VLWIDPHNVVMLSHMKPIGHLYFMNNPQDVDFSIFYTYRRTEMQPQLHHAGRISVPYECRKYIFEFRRYKSGKESD